MKGVRVMEEKGKVKYILGVIIGSVATVLILHHDKLADLIEELQKIH